MSKLYKQHDTGLFDVLRLPHSVIEFYYRNEYKYVFIEGYNKIPVPLFALLMLKTDISEIPMHEYAKGCIEGYNSNLIPFIDTIDSRKEIIFTEIIGKGGQGFKAHHTAQGTTEYRETDMYESGVFEGKRYKAWEIIFQTPNAFIEWFAPPQQTGETKHPTPLKYETIESIFNDTGQIQKVVDCLKAYETLNEKGDFGIDNKKYEILAITEALVFKGIINKDVPKTQRNKLFAKLVNLDIADKTARTKGWNHDTLFTTYKELFDSLK
jgi:hypothetical protein